MRCLDLSDCLWQTETLNSNRKENLGEGVPEKYTQSKPPVFWIDASPLHMRPFSTLVIALCLNVLSIRPVDPLTIHLPHPGPRTLMVKTISGADDTRLPKLRQVRAAGGQDCLDRAMLSSCHSLSVSLCPCLSLLSLYLSRYISVNHVLIYACFSRRSLILLSGWLIGGRGSSLLRVLRRPAIRYRQTYCFCK